MVELEPAASPAPREDGVLFVDFFLLDADEGVFFELVGFTALFLELT